MDGDDYGEQRPLSNADFRRLLETPRPGAGKKEGGEKKKRPKGAKPHKPKPGAEGGAEEAGYRQALRPLPFPKYSSDSSLKRSCHFTPLTCQLIGQGQLSGCEKCSFHVGCCCSGALI